ncbi:hypothetical protein H4R18_002916 [Coemansia javaensis]|uniref:Pre-rRNA-processing protein RIX1 n=1 Tax=Coemansia javaensis TaxID=2761396 RepID=A0A9W8HAF6_9FUNG|nr:hypothetical protein H4R18_002916 [Coemansia javaensis]
MEASVVQAERVLSLLTGTYLAEAERVKANIAAVLDAVLSQRLFAHVGADGVSAGAARRYRTAVDKWLARIKSLAAGATPDSRMAGVLLIKHTALQSPPLFAERAAEWTRILLGVLAKADAAPLLEAVLQTLLAFIDAVRDVPALHQEIATGQIPRMNQAVLAAADKNPDLATGALELLAHSAVWFPTLFRPSIDRAEALCLRLLDGPAARTSPAACRMAARCLAALCLAGGRVSPEDRWFQAAQQAVGTIKQCVDHIMCTETAGDAAAQHFALSALADDVAVSIPQAADRISAMSEVVVELLTQPTGVAVPVPAGSIVGAASALAMVPVRVASSGSGRMEFALASMVAPQIQRAAIRIVAALVLSVGPHMQPFLSGAARTATAIGAHQMSSPATRVALLALIQLCIEQYGFGFAVHLPEDLVVLAVDSICVLREAPTGSVPGTGAAEAPSQPKKRGGGGGRPRAAGAEEPAGASYIHWNDVVHAGLRTVLALLRHTPTVLTSALRIKIDSTVLALLMLGATGGIKTQFAARQSDAPLRELLYRCLEASILSPDPWQKAIVPHAVAAFHAGLDDPSAAVRVACQCALAALDPIVHARLPAQLREPDTEENIEAENLVPQMLRAGGSTVSISAALSGTHLDGHPAEPEPRADAPEADGAKRFKHDTAKTEEHQEFQSVSNTRYDPPAPAAAPAASPPIAAAVAAAAPVTDNVNDDGNDDDNDDEIPDIVMEDSDED